MNKYFLLFAYIILFTLSFQYFFSGEKAKIENKDGILISIIDDTLVVPNAPGITLENYTATGFIVNPCKDISMSIDSKPLVDIEKTAPKFCQDIMIGPKEKKSLPMSEIASIMSNLPGRYLLTVKTPLGDRMTTFDLSMPGALRSLMTTVFYNPIYNFFVGLITWLPGHSLGWAIVIITIIIRMILLVPQQHMMESQKKLGLIQPKIKALQEKHGGGHTAEEKRNNQAKLGMEMLELYKKEGVSPMGSCLPLLIQMPILIGLYWVISSITDPSNFYHLYSFFRDFEISKINTIFYGINLQSIGGTVGITFAIVLAAIQYIQAKLSFAYNPPPKKEEKKPKKEGEIPEIALDPAMMQKSMLYVLPVVIGVSALFFPIGVALYWFIGTLFVIAQQWYVNQKKVK